MKVPDWLAILVLTAELTFILCVVFPWAVAEGVRQSKVELGF